MDNNTFVVKVLQMEQDAEIARLKAEVAELKPQAGLYHEIVKRLRGAFIVAHLGDWTEWQAAIELFLKAAQTQAHFAGLASERYDKLLQNDREACYLRGELADLKRQLAEARKDTEMLIVAAEPFCMKIPEVCQAAMRILNQTAGQIRNLSAALDAARREAGEKGGSRG